MEPRQDYNVSITAEDLPDLDLGDAPFDLVRGNVVREPMSGVRHGVIVARLTARLDACLHLSGGGHLLAGDAGFILSRNPDTVRGPDIAFIRHDRLTHAMSETGLFEGAPDLAIEVLSPSDRPSRIKAKVSDYLEAGALEVWLVDPQEQQVTVCTQGSGQRLDAADTLTCESLLPGFALLVGRLFR
jgi:Uma2 family endonuclease